MRFNDHYKLRDRHAVFSPSQSSWLRYDDEKLVTVMNNMRAKELGTRLHAWAKETIDLRIRQPKTKTTLAMYVNDGIGYKMDTEVVLYYSDYFFGTADSICFRNNVLRIHDLKTGTIPAHMDQLEIYAALFCLEYKHLVDLSKIKFELRIYQNNEVLVHTPTVDDIVPIMDLIVHQNKILEKENYEEV